MLLVSSLRRPWSRRSQILGVLNKKVSGDTQVAKQQQSFTEGMKVGKQTLARWFKSNICGSSTLVPWFEWVFIYYKG
jgi:hypothetical protein